MFAAYGVVQELLYPTEIAMVKIILGSMSLTFNYLLKVAVVTSGSGLTKEAQRTAIVISKIINETACSESRKIDFIFFMSQIKSRDVNVKNNLFLINWKLLLAVSC